MFNARDARVSNQLALALTLGAAALGCAQMIASPSTATGKPAITADDFQKVVDDAHAKYKDDTGGKNADYIPFLAKVPSNLFGVVIATKDGKVYEAGDTDYRFAIQSVSKPFTAALIMQRFGGPEAIQEKIGVEPTGFPFNSKIVIELLEDRSVNPLVNAGAIASVSMLEATSEAERWKLIESNLEGFAGSELPLLEDCFKSEYDTCWGNRGIANNLFNYQRLYCEPEEALRVYTKQCSVGISCVDLAMMGATIANGGVNPKTGKRLLDAEHIPELLSLMMTAGFYDESGHWSYTTGLPAKTGVGGGIVAVVPGQFAIAAFSPPLNEAGNSVRAQKAIRHIAGELGVGVFGANPE